MEKLSNFLGIVDYMVILGSLLICVAIGVYHKLKSNKSKSVEEYFLGNRKMPILPIALSILATTVSAVPLVSGVGEMYTYGMEYSFITIGILIGTIPASYFIIPVFRYLDYISIYEYLENRFDRSVRMGFSLFYILMNLLSSAVVLYVPTLLLANVTGFPYWIMAAVSGILCTSYCVLGGYKTVVFTDVVQFVFMIVSLVVILWRGTITAGGSSYVWTQGMVQGFFNNVHWLDASDRRFTVASSIIYGIFVSLQHYTTSQAVVQRLLSVKNIKAAQSSLLITLVSRTIFSGLLLGGAAVIFANFHLCDPLQRVKETGVKSSDLILLYYLQKFLSDMPGLSGIVFAGILSSALSTLSSYINSFAATTLEDFIKPYLPKLVNTEKREIMASKAITGAYGLLVLILSFLIPFMGGAIKAIISITGAVGGPLTGVMFLALFFPKVNKRACILALLVGVTFCLWLTFASPLYKTKFQTMPLSTEACPSNVTLPIFDNNTLTLNETSVNEVLLTPTAVNKSYVFPLYKLSFVWYGPLGLSLTVILGWAASLLFAGKKEEIDSRLLSPLVTRKMVKPIQVATLVPTHDPEEEMMLNRNQVYLPTVISLKEETV